MPQNGTQTRTSGGTSDVYSDPPTAPEGGVFAGQEALARTATEGTDFMSPKANGAFFELRLSEKTPPPRGTAATALANGKPIERDASRQDDRAQQLAVTTARP